MVIFRLFIVCAIISFCFSQCANKAQEVPGIAVQLWTFKEFSLEEALRKADSAGLQTVEIFEGQRISPSDSVKLDPSITDSSLNEIIHLAEKQDIHINSGYFSAPRDTAGWLNLFALAKKLNLSYLVMEPPANSLDLADSLAAANGVIVALHNHPEGRSQYWHPDTVASAVKNRKALAVCADLGHWARSGVDPAANILKLKDRIVGIHVKDIDQFGNRTAADLVPGSGTIDYQKVIAALKKINYHGMLVIEREDNWLNNTRDVKDAAAFLKKLWNKQ